MNLGVVPNERAQKTETIGEEFAQIESLGDLLLNFKVVVKALFAGGPTPNNSHRRIFQAMTSGVAPFDASQSGLHTGTVPI